MAGQAASEKPPCETEKDDPSLKETEMAVQNAAEFPPNVTKTKTNLAASRFLCRTM